MVNDQLLAGANADRALHLGEASDPLAIDGGHDVAGLEAGPFRSTAGLDLVDARGGAGLAEESEQAGEDHDREQEVGDRAGRHDRRARSNLLVMKTARALFRGHLGERLGRRRGGFALVAEELHIAAERDR